MVSLSVVPEPGSAWLPGLALKARVFSRCRVT